MQNTHEAQERQKKEKKERKKTQAMFNPKKPKMGVVCLEATFSTVSRLPRTARSEAPSAAWLSASRVRKGNQKEWTRVGLKIRRPGNSWFRFREKGN